MIRQLLHLGVKAIVVVDDGSGPGYQRYFEDASQLPGVDVLRHAVNLGKGAALKTGLNHALVRFPSCPGVVTADADGQHLAADIVRICTELQQSPGALLMGVRTFSQSVPWKSRLGNRLTRSLMRVMIGQHLSDSQTGLRGIPAALIPHILRLPAYGYELELDMLLACKHQSYPIREEPIQTVYLDGNKSSHFNPIFDSMRIYLVLFRFAILSVSTALLDNLVFAIAYLASGSIAGSQVAGRLVAMIWNYLGARRVVFHSQQRHQIVLPKYIALVVANGVASYLLIRYLHAGLGLPVIVSKLLAEGGLFVLNFIVQRDLVFSRRPLRPVSDATDWTNYYTSVPPTARLTRRYTARTLLDLMRRFGHGEGPARPAAIVEIGGANSCFLDSILSHVPCRSFDVVDTNPYGLALLEARVQGRDNVHLHQQSVLDLPVNPAADIVFSVGLVEHFNPAQTREAVLAHFNLLKPGGVAIITFPTPTALYRLARHAIEMAGMWKFPDERPLSPREVIDAILQRGDLLCQKTLWPLILTQHVVVARKR